MSAVSLFHPPLLKDHSFSLRRSDYTNYFNTFDIQLGNAPARTPPAGQTEPKRELIKTPKQHKTKSVKKPKAKKMKKVTPKHYL